MYIKIKQNILIMLIILTLLFIWGNSLLPSSVSGAISGWIRDLVMSIFNSLTHKYVSTGDGVLRKIAHATEFAVFGAELTLLLRVIMKKSVSLLLLSGLSAALIDETIQLFVNGRAGLVVDIWIDTCGFLIGIALCSMIVYMKKKQGYKAYVSRRLEI